MKANEIKKYAEKIVNGNVDVEISKESIIITFLEATELLLSFLKHIVRNITGVRNNFTVGCKDGKLFIKIWKKNNCGVIRVDADNVETKDIAEHNIMRPTKEVEYIDAPLDEIIKNNEFNIEEYNSGTGLLETIDGMLNNN